MIARDIPILTKSTKNVPLSNMQLDERARESRRASNIPSGRSDSNKPHAIGSSLARMSLNDMNYERRSSSAIGIRHFSSASSAHNENNMRATSSSMMRMPTDNPIRERRSSSVTVRRPSTIFVVTDAPRPLPLGSRAPEIIVKKKILYNTQVTSVSSVIYDENWASKQTKSYTDCLNQIFSSSLGSQSNNSEMDVPTGLSSWSDGEATFVLLMLMLMLFSSTLFYSSWDLFCIDLINFWSCNY